MRRDISVACKCGRFIYCLASSNLNDYIREKKEERERERNFIRKYFKFKRKKELLLFFSDSIFSIAINYTTKEKSVKNTAECLKVSYLKIKSSTTFIVLLPVTYTQISQVSR